MSEPTQVLNKRLKDIDKTISTLTKERLFLHDVLKRYRLERVGGDNELLYPLSSKETERRGLRAAGRTREIFDSKTQSYSGGVGKNIERSKS
jgi:CO dehydrogenase/acetyl-CoA synthase delta subunit